MISSANLKCVNLLPLILIPLSSQLKFLNISFITAGNNLGDIVSPWRTHLRYWNVVAVIVKFKSRGCNAIYKLECFHIRFVYVL